MRVRFRDPGSASTYCRTVAPSGLLADISSSLGVMRVVNDHLSIEHNFRQQAARGTDLGGIDGNGNLVTRLERRLRPTVLIFANDWRVGFGTPGYSVALRVFDIVHNVYMRILPSEFRYSSFHGYTL